MDIPLTMCPALQRLKLYFPDSYRALAGRDLKTREAYEAQGSKDRISTSQQFLNPEHHRNLTVVAAQWESTNR